MAEYFDFEDSCTFLDNITSPIRTLSQFFVYLMLVSSRSQMIDGVGVQEIGQLIQQALNTAEAVQKIWEPSPNSEVVGEVLSSSIIFG